MSIPATPLWILLATANPHKVEELRAIFAAERLDGVELVGLTQCPGPTTEPHEHGTSFEANAAIKALSYAAQTGLLALADDSGLEVDALGGKPGVISSHYSTDGRETGLTRDQRDHANNQRLLRELQGVSASQRTARFVCVMALAAPHASTPITTVRGEFEGRIGEPPRVPAGTHGFGYDPLFLVAPEYAKTGAELDPVHKNARSHRALAARQLARWLRDHRASLVRMSPTASANSGTAGSRPGTTR